MAAVLELMDSEATVAHDEHITDRHGHTRQFDVVIRSEVAGYRLLGVIECKDWKRPVGTPAVEKFITKSRDVQANFCAIASRSGFSEPALERAHFAGIGTISLLPDDPERAGFAVGTQWYAKVFSWSKVEMTLHFVAQDVNLSGFDPRRVTKKGKPAIDWFHNLLVTKYRTLEEECWIGKTVIFDKKRLFEIGDQKHFLQGISFRGKRVCEKKTKRVAWSGDAFYDWEEEALKVPPNATLTTEPFQADFSDWEPYEGEIPPSAGRFDVRWTVFADHFTPDSEVFDLTAL